MGNRIKTFVRWAKIYIKQHPRLAFYVPAAGATLVLIATVLYDAVHANYQLSIDSDYIVYPYLFHNFKLHDIVLPAYHSNILFFPLYLLQANLPFNYTSFSLVNVGLDLVSILLWVYLLVKIFGKKYLVLISLLVACIICGSSSFIYNLTGDTIRNIEYPIALAFILLINEILKGKKLSRKLTIIGAIVSILFVMSMAGDSLLLYSVVAPLTFVLFIYWLQSTKVTLPMLRATGLIVAVSVLAFIVRKLLAASGIVGFFSDPTFSPHSIPMNQLSFSITTTLRQIVDMHNANFFDMSKVPLSSAIVLINFGLLVVAIIGFVYLVGKVLADYKQGKKITDHSNYICAVLAISFVAIPAVYILGGQAVHALPNGMLVNSEQARYLTMLPLLSIVGITYFVKEYYGYHKTLLFMMPIALVIVMVVSSGYIRQEINNIGSTRAANERMALSNIVTAAHQNNVPFMLTGYWYGAATRFYSGNTIKFASIGDCNTVQPQFNTRLSWYDPSSQVHRSALLVDTAGPDKPTWNCSFSHLQSIYGKPAKIVYINGIQDYSPQTPIAKDSIQMWIYNYDVRSKVDTSNLLRVLN